MGGISQKWKDTMDQAVSDPVWNEYDDVIKKEVAAYKSKFSNKPALPHVDWLILKAMLWNESGGPSNPAWKKRALQIGNKGDPALSVLVKGAEGSKLVVDASLLQDLIAGKHDDSKINIRAGIAYLYTRMATYEDASVRDSIDKDCHQYTVVSGDNLSVIAGKVGTTVQELKAQNPTASKVIRPNDVLDYYKASVQMVIKGWRQFDTKTVAARYNGGGDPDYAGKLDYILKHVIPKQKKKSK